MSRRVNKNKPHVLFLDTENVGIDELKAAEQNIEQSFVFVKERRAYERSNCPISKSNRATLEAMGYTIINIGKTTAKNAVDNAIKQDMWAALNRYQKYMVLITQDGGFSLLIEDLKRSKATVFLPKLSHSSNKLKRHSELSERITSNWAFCRQAACSDITCEIEKLEALGTGNPLGVFCDLSPEDEIKLGEPVVNAIKNNPAVHINGWIYTKNLSWIIGPKWTKVIIGHMRRHSDHYRMLGSNRLGTNKYPVFRDASLPECAQPLSGRNLDNKVLRGVIRKFEDKIPLRSDIRLQKQLENFLKEMESLDDGVRAAIKINNEVAHTAMKISSMIHNAKAH